jgi:hypothetical protein
MTTDQRLERLERQNRWMKVAVASMAVVLAVVFLIAAGEDQEKDKVLEEVRAKKLVLVDEQNVERGMMSCERNRVELRLQYSNGKSALRIAVRENKIRTDTVNSDRYNTDIRLFDAETGNATVRLSTTNGERTRLRLDAPGERNQSWIDLEVPHDRDPDIVVRGKDGKPIFKAPK